MLVCRLYVCTPSLMQTSYHTTVVYKLQRLLRNLPHNDKDQRSDRKGTRINRLCGVCVRFAVVGVADFSSFAAAESEVRDRRHAARRRLAVQACL